jgi:hypothetical protein
LFLEMPPGHVLTHLAEEAFPYIETVAVGEVSLKDAVRLGRSQGDRSQDNQDNLDSF